MVEKCKFQALTSRPLQGPRLGLELAMPAAYYCGL